ncbi:transcriptional regulator, AraC family [Ruegeria pomeroyi DSS-3]|uniref:Transcriptional regulator, AraC family n=3 Tax=Ruegeria pomeroyi TaxID=89184 RepID=Q5LPA0_RUEPO|nr:transcriptional regulator, AraC family [Ruegeria pomeroyi DSS-3]NVK96449.1 AraC family transcriptional regulator [Ruegeria pomeroyi]HCE71396.1 AraC family transcriptional regulator [Ruegeria sp.]
MQELLCDRGKGRHADPMQNKPDTPPLSRFHQFRTADLDEARALVARNFCGHRLERQAREDAFDACQNRAGGNGLFYNYIRYGADVEIEPGELGSFYLIQVPIRGQALIRNGRTEVETGSAIASVLNPDRHTRMRWLAGCEQVLLQIDRNRLTAVAETLTGTALQSPVRFDPQIDRARPEMQRWLALFRRAVSAVDHGALLDPDQALSRALVEDELIAGFLRAQPSSIAPLLERPETGPLSPHVRRARDFMQAHLADPLTLSQIAAAAGTSPRNLQLGFSQLLEMTPLAYLRVLRLNYARYLLRESPPQVTIASIAGAAGFSHLGRFSAQYAARFGEGPSQTRKQHYLI